MAAKQQKLEIPASCFEMWQNFLTWKKGGLWGHVILFFCLTRDVEATESGYYGNKNGLIPCVSFASRQASRQRKASACILYALSWFQKQRRLRQTSNKSYRIQNLLNWDYWEVNFRCNILRHRFLGKVLADKIIKIKLREFLAGHVWTQIKHGGQRTVYTLLITMVKWGSKRTLE